MALTERGNNTKFFHSHVRHRTKINSILELTNFNGNFITNEVDIRLLCQTHFNHLFNLPCSSHPDPTNFSTISNISHHLTPHQPDDLNRPFTSDEVRSALFQMPHFKSPGPDGFPAEFFQKHWNNVGESLSNETLSFLNNGHILKEI
ncbi:hypothetical protein LIER_36198 [Lithospermum erythrorhizon]|uniref:Reverse transcriptase n=1 Tax=Lithospermum erythrorhizon TaxID=34254 RepID=A0AAV3P6E2_LITER